MKRTISLSILALALSACSLTPEQLQALDGGVCNKAAAGTVSFTTTAVGGASKSGALVIDGDTCGIVTRGKALP